MFVAIIADMVLGSDLFRQQAGHPQHEFFPDGALLFLPVDVQHGTAGIGHAEAFNGTRCTHIHIIDPVLKRAGT